MIKYCDHKYFQQVFNKLPQKDVEELKPALEEFLRSEDAIGEEHGVEEVASVAMLCCFLNEKFSDMKSLWEPGTFSNSNHVGELEDAISEVNIEHGFDCYGLPHIHYVVHDEFKKRFQHLPRHVRDRIDSEFANNDPGEDEWDLMDDEGRLSSEQFVEWCNKNIPDLDDKTSKQLHELGQVMEEINRKVMRNRAAAIKRGELEKRDSGPKPFELTKRI